jgi:hypothetical protein
MINVTRDSLLENTVVGMSAFSLMVLFSAASAFSSEPERYTPSLDQRIEIEVGKFAIEVFPNKKPNCRWVYQELEDNFYEVCLVKGETTYRSIR